MIAAVNSRIIRDTTFEKYAKIYLFCDNFIISTNQIYSVKIQVYQTETCTVKCQLETPTGKRFRLFHRILSLFIVVFQSNGLDISVQLTVNQ